MNSRTSYRMYLKDSPIGISLFAYSLDKTGDDMLFFNDADNNTICCIGMERVDHVQRFDCETMKDVIVFENEKMVA